jgi:putative acetyltransferase
LYQALEGFVKEKLVEKIEADVSLTAKPFFIKKGFEVVREQQVMVQDEVLTNFRMVKKLLN